MATKAVTTHPLNQAQLIQAVAAERGVSFAHAEEYVHTILDIIARTLIAGHSVTITNFGSLTTRTAPARSAHNLQTGQRMLVPARRTLKWRTSDRLAALIAAGDPTASIRKLPKGSLTKDTQ